VLNVVSWMRQQPQCLAPRLCCDEVWARISQDDVVSQAKKLAKRGPQAAEAGSKPEASGEDEGTEERQADTAPAIALD
jgi:hypothetical protein